MGRFIKIELKTERKELAYLAGLIAATIGLLFSAYQIHDQAQEYEFLKSQHENLIQNFKKLNDSSNVLLQRHAIVTSEMLSAKSNSSILDQQVKNCNRFLKDADSECKISRDEDVDVYVNECNVYLRNQSIQCDRSLSAQVRECNYLLKKQLKECNDYWQEQIKLVR